MNIQDYAAQARNTEAPITPELIDRMVNCARLNHHVSGCVTEAGELADALKKHIYYGKPLDVTNMLEEVGDMLWYLTGLVECLCEESSEVGDCFNQIMETNIAKLRARFPNKFTEFDAINRELDVERNILEECVVPLTLRREKEAPTYPCDDVTFRLKTNGDTPYEVVEVFGSAQSNPFFVSYLKSKPDKLNPTNNVWFEDISQPLPVFYDDEEDGILMYVIFNAEQQAQIKKWIGG